MRAQTCFLAKGVLCLWLCKRKTEREGDRWSAGEAYSDTVTLVTAN